jgi:hypothetical protein
MFATLSQSWQFAKTSYSILWQCKKLLVFPLISTIAAGLVIASFLVPLWTSGTIDAWADAPEGDTRIDMWVTLFGFYFANYFVIVFFNCALIACVMKMLEGEEPTIGYGLAMAGRRLWQIFGWALLSAAVGVLLRMVENAHKRAGDIVAAILGSAWTALTYFVVPVIVMEGAGAGASFKRSLGILKHHWGTALISNFSIGLITFIIAIPVWLVVALLVYVAAQSGSTSSWALAIGVGATGIVLVALASSAADTILKALLYSHATGRTIPADVPSAQFEMAFTPRDSR